MQVLQNSLLVEDALRRVFLSNFDEKNVSEILALTQDMSENFKSHDFVVALETIASKTELVDEARYEYNTLFVGPRRPKALPYESAYFDYKTLFGAQTIQVREIYAKAGLRVEASQFDKFPDDFIGFELQFLYFLSFEALKFLQNKQMDEYHNVIKTKSSFISEHASKWFYEFAKRCTDAASLDIWKAFADFLTLYLKSEEQNLMKILAKAK